MHTEIWKYFSIEHILMMVDPNWRLCVGGGGGGAGGRRWEDGIGAV